MQKAAPVQFAGKKLGQAVMMSLVEMLCASGRVVLRGVHLLQCYKRGKYGGLLRSNLLQKPLQGATRALPVNP